MQRIGTALWMASAIGLAMSGAAPAAPAKSPPARPGAHAAKAPPKGPTLAVTLAYIQEKLGQQGLIAYAGAMHDSADNTNWVNKFSIEASKVTVDEPNCRVDFHWRTSAEGKFRDSESGFDFRRITAVQVIGMDEDVARIAARDGHPTWTSTISPPVQVLQALRTDGTSVTVDFRDRDTADRVAKAIRHAADLCGGSKAEPF